MIKIVFPMLVIFQVVTLFLYYLGPIKYLSVGQVDSVVALVCCYLVVLVLGYIAGRGIYLKGRTGPRDLFKFLKYASVFTLIFSVIDIIYSYRMIGGAANIGEIYNQVQDGKTENLTVLAYLRMFFGYFMFGLFPAFLLWRDHVPRRLYFFCVVAIGANLISGILMGVNKKLFDYLIIAVVIGLIRVRSAWELGRLAKFGVTAVISLVLAGSFFLQGQLTRSGSFAISGVSTKLGAYSDYNSADGDLFVFYSAISGYLSQGYRAIELSFDVPFDFTWGVGNSSFFSRQVDKIFGTNIEDFTYPAKIEIYGWDRYNQWSSFYAWWASDLTFYGVTLLMFLVGFLFRCVENTLIIQKDIASTVVYSYLVILCSYLSANNQIFQSGETALGFLFLGIPILTLRKFVRFRGGKGAEFV